MKIEFGDLFAHFFLLLSSFRLSRLALTSFPEGRSKLDQYITSTQAIYCIVQISFYSNKKAKEQWLPTTLQPTTAARAIWSALAMMDLCTVSYAITTRNLLSFPLPLLRLTMIPISPTCIRPSPAVIGMAPSTLLPNIPNRLGHGWYDTTKTARRPPAAKSCGDFYPSIAPVLANHHVRY